LAVPEGRGVPIIADRFDGEKLKKEKDEVVTRMEFSITRESSVGPGVPQYSLVQLDNVNLWAPPRSPQQ
jgi:hypothetical protein